MLIRLFEVFLAAMWILIGVTQVFLPLLLGLPIFPVFRRRRTLERRLAEARERKEEAVLVRQVRELEDEANLAAQSPEPPPATASTEGGTTDGNA